MTNATSAADTAADLGTNLDSVKRRIAKLLAIAEDARGDANECAAAAAMAERLMRKFQIDNIDLVTAQLKSGAAEFFASEDVGSSLNPEGSSESSSGWAGILAVAVADLHDVQVRYTQTYKHGKTLRFSGYASDAQTARFTYIYLVQTMAQASREFLRSNEGTNRRDAENFRRGFNSAVCKNLRQATADKRADMQKASTSNALVVLKDSAVAKHFGAVKYSKSKARARVDMAFTDGFARGNQVDVGRRGLSTGAAAPQLA
jgi:hypothetical protein